MPVLRLSHRGRRRDSRRAVSLFSGAGGLDLGLEAVGWDVLAQIEMDEDCAGTLKMQAERQGLNPRIINSRVELVDPGALRRELGLKRGELELLAGGPPCQPFTTTGLRRATNDDRASKAFPSMLDFVAEFMPRAMLIENVDGLLSAALSHRPLVHRGPHAPPMQFEERKGSFLLALLKRLTGLGYSVTWGLVEAADYGVAQRRQRAVLIASREARPCFLPDRRFGGQGQPPVRTLRDVLHNLPADSPVQPLSERKCRVFDRIPSGGNWRDLSETLRRQTMGAAYHAEGGKGGWWRRLSWSDPAPTILGMPDHSSTALVHPDETRCLSVAECAALQSFPAWVRFAGKPRSQYQQVGNAVPPGLGEALGRVISEYLDGVEHPVPAPPAWRQESANRRIGTHGWGVVHRTVVRYHLHVRVRDDHVWADHDREQQRLAVG